MRNGICNHDKSSRAIPGTPKEAEGAPFMVSGTHTIPISLVRGSRMSLRLPENPTSAYYNLDVQLDGSGWINGDRINGLFHLLLKWGILGL